MSAEHITDLFPVADDRLIVHEIDDDLVLYNPQTDAVHILNETASVIWWLCDGKRNGREILQEFNRLFAKNQDQSFQEVLTTLSQLVELHVVWTRPTRATIGGL